MYCKNNYKYLFYLFHIFIILSSFIGIFFTWKVIILQGTTIISWKLNQNKCILTQLEDYLFNETIIDLYKKYKNNKNNKNNYFVPFSNRLALYLLTFIELIIYFNNKKIEIYIYKYIL
jgi:hypothetical protein